MEQTNSSKKHTRILSWITLACFAAGSAVGLLFPQLFTYIGFIGTIYVNLLKLMALPIVLCTVFGAASRGMRSASGTLVKAILLFVILFTVSFLLSGALYSVLSPGKGFTLSSGEVLGKLSANDLLSEHLCLARQRRDAARDPVRVLYGRRCGKGRRAPGHGAGRRARNDLFPHALVYPVADADFENISAELQTRANDIVYKLSLLRRNASFEGYDEIRARIYSTPTEDLRAEKLCRTLGHSAGYFRAMYKELFGLSFHQDLIRSRISYAKLLILTDNSSFASIASRCGYNDEKHFYHQFRQITGLSPKQYRAG